MTALVEPRGGGVRADGGVVLALEGKGVAKADPAGGKVAVKFMYCALAAVKIKY